MSPPTAAAEKNDSEPSETKPTNAGANGDGKKSSNGKQQHHDDEFGGMYYFYQAADGQHVFLQPLAFRCLLQEYGSIDKLPKKVRIQEIYMDYVVTHSFF